MVSSRQFTSAVTYVLEQAIYPHTPREPRGSGSGQPPVTVARGLHSPAVCRPLQLSFPGAAFFAEDRADRARGNGCDRRAGDAAPRAASGRIVAGIRALDGDGR